MSDLWNEDVTHWWLPNDEGFPDIIRSIRDFVEYRAGVPTDAVGADVRNMSGIFRDMHVHEPDHADLPVSVWDSSPEQFEP